MSERDAKQVVCPRCGGTKTGTKEGGLSMCFECGVFWGWGGGCKGSARRHDHGICIECGADITDTLAGQAEDAADAREDR